MSVGGYLKEKKIFLGQIAYKIIVSFRPLVPESIKVLYSVCPREQHVSSIGAHTAGNTGKKGATKMFRTLSIAIIFLATFAAASAQTTNPPQPPTVSAPAAVCDPSADKVLVAEWNTSQVRTLCADYTGMVNATASIWAPSTRQILLGDERNFLTYSSSGRLRWFTPKLTWTWLVPGNGRIQNKQGEGFTLTDRWEVVKIRLFLWTDDYFYTSMPMPIANADFCTSSATNAQSIGVCAYGFNKTVAVSRQIDFAGHREERHIKLEQYPVGAVAVGEKLYVVLATEQIYPPCNEPMCSTGAPISVLPGKLMEIGFGYGQAEPSQTVVLDGLNVQSNMDLNRVATGTNSIYFVSGQAKILRYTPGTKKLGIYYDAGENAFIGALAVVPGR